MSILNNFQIGSTYTSDRGPVTYYGLDNYHGEVTFHFTNGRNHYYWLSSSLNDHFSCKKETPKTEKEEQEEFDRLSKLMVEWLKRNTEFPSSIIVTNLGSELLKCKHYYEHKE